LLLLNKSTTKSTSNTIKYNKIFLIAAFTFKIKGRQFEDKREMSDMVMGRVRGLRVTILYSLLRKRPPPRAAV
jgi:hypothetical protein